MPPSHLSLSQYQLLAYLTQWCSPVAAHTTLLEPGKSSWWGRAESPFLISSITQNFSDLQGMVEMVLEDNQHLNYFVSVFLPKWQLSQQRVDDCLTAKNLSKSLSWRCRENKSPKLSSCLPWLHSLTCILDQQSAAGLQMSLDLTQLCLSF